MSTMRRVIAMSVGLLIAAAASAGAPLAGAQTTSRAVVIVSTGSGVHTTVIEFSGTVSGLEALQLAGASPETITYGPMGQAICKLYGSGDAPVPGSCPGGWVYYRAVGGAGGWSQSGLGASSTTVHDGDVEGWGYGAAPPFSSFCAVAGCAPPATDPPVTAPPAASTAPGAAGGPTTGGVSVDGATATIGPAGETSTPAAGAESAGATTTTVAKAGSQKAQSAGRTLGAGVPAATTSGHDGGGSPVGVIVAVVIVVALVGGGVMLRKRRTG